MRRWQRLVGILALTVAGVHGLDRAMKTAPLPAPAARFFYYLEVLDHSGTDSLWDRILFSWILSSSTPSVRSSSSTS